MNSEMRDNDRAKAVRQEIVRLLKRAEKRNNTRAYDRYAGMLADFDELLIMGDERIEELEAQLYRNPAFPGDEVGWLPDDFDDEDDDDD